MLLFQLQIRNTPKIKMAFITYYMHRELKLTWLFSTSALFKVFLHQDCHHPETVLTSKMPMLS